MDTFSALSDPGRRRILDCISAEPTPVNTVVASVGMSQPVVSKHLRILRDAGLVNVTPEGQRRLYSVRTDPLREVDAWLDRYRAVWNDRFDALETHLDSTAGKGESS